MDLSILVMIRFFKCFVCTCKNPILFSETWLCKLQYSTRNHDNFHVYILSWFPNAADFLHRKVIEQKHKPSERLPLNLGL